MDQVSDMNYTSVVVPLWLVSNFTPMDSKNFGFRNFDYIIRFGIENESEIEKLRSPESDDTVEIPQSKLFRIFRNKV